MNRRKVMAGEPRRASLVAWLESHPIPVMGGLMIAGLILLIGSAMLLDQQAAERDAELIQQLRLAGDTPGAMPSALPREIVRGQTVYVPLYSHVFTGEGNRRMLLSGTLSIRNTDSKRTLTIAAVDYYDTEGKLVRGYLEEPLKLNPLGSTQFFVRGSDVSGGSGANFLVEWVADEPVYAPVIEAVMVGREGTGITSFVRPGQVIERFERD
jgi:hypothetical protein